MCEIRQRKRESFYKKAWSITGMCNCCLTVLWMREVKARIREQGTGMPYDSEKKWETSQLLFADDTSLIVDTWEKL